MDRVLPIRHPIRIQNPPIPPQQNPSLFVSTAENHSNPNSTNTQSRTLSTISSPQNNLDLNNQSNSTTLNSANALERFNHVGIMDPNHNLGCMLSLGSTFTYRHLSPKLIQKIVLPESLNQWVAEQKSGDSNIQQSNNNFSLRVKQQILDAYAKSTRTLVVGTENYASQDEYKVTFPLELISTYMNFITKLVIYPSFFIFPPQYILSLNPAITSLKIGDYFGAYIDNNICEIPKNFFRNLSHLNDLSICFDGIFNIQQLPNFSYLSQLTNLELKLGNESTLANDQLEFPFELLNNFPKLKKLIFNGFPNVSLTVHCFPGKIKSQLEELTIINSNELVEINENAFNGFNSLKHLVFDTFCNCNLFYNLGVFHGLEKLESLTIENCLDIEEAPEENSDEFNTQYIREFAANNPSVKIISSYLISTHEIITMIKQYSAINTDDNVNDVEAAQVLLNKNKDLIDLNTLRDLVTSLIENCSSLKYSNNHISIRHKLIAEQLLDKYKAYFNSDTFLRLVKYFINSNITLISPENLQSVKYVKKLLIKYKLELGNTYEMLVERSREKYCHEILNKWVHINYSQAGYVLAKETILNHINNKDNTTLDLSHCGLDSLPPAVIFIYLKHIKTLNLTNNNLKQILEGTFKGLTNLQVLNLRDNQLTKIPINMLNELSNLQELFLENNSLGNEQSKKQKVIAE